MQTETTEPLARLVRQAMDRSTVTDSTPRRWPYRPHRTDRPYRTPPDRCGWQLERSSRTDRTNWSDWSYWPPLVLTVPLLGRPDLLAPQVLLAQPATHLAVEHLPATSL